MAIDALAAIPEMLGAGAADAGAAAADVGASALGGLGGLETGLGSIGAGAAGTAGAGAAGLGDITGAGAGLFGGTTGLEGTALASGATGGIPGLLGAGAGAAGTAADFMGAPGASAFSPGAMSSDASAFGSIPGASSSAPGSSGFPTFNQDGTMMGNLTSSQGQVPAAPGSSVFSTGTAPLTGSPGAASSGATPFASPSGVSSPGAGAFDPTSAAATAGQGATPAAAASTATPAASGAAPAATSFGDKVLNSVSNNPFGAAGLGIAGAGLASSLMNKNNVPGQSQVNAINSTIPQLQQLASQATAQSQKIANSTGPLDANTLQMLSYVNNGQLPPAMQAQVDNGVQAAKAAATSAMASRGMPADPASNPQLASQLATIDSQALEMKGQLQNQLYQSGLQAWNASNQTQQVAGQLQTNALSATGLDLQTYMGLQNIYQNQSNQEQAAIGNLAQALGRMGTGSGNNTLTIKSG
jgi:hypothetical protein